MDRLLLKSDEAAEVLGISRTHFYQLSASGELGPMAIRLGKCSLWSYAELLAWVDARCPAREQWQDMKGAYQHHGRSKSDVKIMELEERERNS